jgi:uncharacterized protein (DUF1810 family)
MPPRAGPGRAISDPYGLGRFLLAQDAVYASVLAELRAGRKESHWIWFVFPQLAGLGSSAMSERYAISSLDEARAYLAHPILGPRLRECVSLVLALRGRAIEDIFPYPDDLKFRSCITLFAEAAEGANVFLEALRKYFRGEADAATSRMLARPER